MHRTLAAVALAVLVAAPATVVPVASARAAPLSGAETKKVGDAFRSYLRERDAKARDKLWKSVEKLAAKLAPAELEELIRAAVPGDEWDGGYTDAVEFTSAGETWTYSAVLPKKRPKELLPLVLDIGHGSWKDNDAEAREEGMRTWLRVAGAQDAVVYVRTRVIDRLSTDGRYDAWVVPPRRDGDGPNMDTLASIVMDAVRDACLRYPVDPDHVYVQGISQTGFWTWWLATYAPDRWAAAAPVGAVTWHVRPNIVNAVRVPVYVLHGTNDPTCRFEEADSAVKALRELGGDVDFRPTDGGGHMDGVFVRFGEIWPEMRKRRRDAYPKQFERRLVSGARPDAFWLRAEGVAAKGFNPWAPPCRVAGTIDGQTLRVEASGCERVVVLVATGMVDVAEPVTIVLNGKKKWSGRLEPDARAALDVARERGDAAPFCTAVPLDL